MQLIPYFLYNVTNTLFFASYVGVDLIDLVNKLLEMGNSRNRARKTRRNMPIEKQNEVREKARKEQRKGWERDLDVASSPREGLRAA